MKLVVAFMFLLGACLGQRPHPCKSPPLLSGSLVLVTQNERLWLFSNYMYDAYRQRVRFSDFGALDNQTIQLDILLLYKEQVAYVIDHDNQTCSMYPLSGDYEPTAIPEDAHLLAQSFIGSSSGPREGVLVNTWFGNLPHQDGQYIITMTEFGCVPVSSMYHTTEYGWMIMDFFNNVKGLPDPGELNPPSFCPDPAKAGFNGQKPVNFLGLFQQML